MAFEDISLVNRANSLATYELLGDADLMNKELERYRAVTEKKFRTNAAIFLLIVIAARCII